jgi:iron complex transport system ATP-binding protein
VTVVELAGATVRRAGREILSGVDWTVCAGEHWAILGPNGAGKTTLLRLASAQNHPSSGTATILGGRMGRVPVQELRARIGLVEPAFGRAVLPGRTPLHLVLSGATGTLATLTDRIGPDEEAHARQLLAEVGAAELADRAIGTCSEGERARILLARALMLDAPLLVLDEPAGGLDLPGRELLLAALARSAAARPGLATVTATHHLEELPTSTTHALLLRGGRVVAAGEPDAVLTDAALSDCFGLRLRVERHDGRYLVHAEKTPENA